MSFASSGGDMQTWNYVLLFKFNVGRQFYAPKPARTQSLKTFVLPPN